VLSDLSLQRDYAESLGMAIDANLEGQRSWIKQETDRMQRELSEMKERKNRILDKTTAGVIPDDLA
jgi:hypothetical protein